MPPRAVARICLLLFLLPAAASADEFVLYAPTKVASGRQPASPAEGVLTRSVTVRPGDTLKRLSRRYGGRASYFPQILLFNQIGNPDLIRVGDRLLVPVARSEKSDRSRTRGKALGHHGRKRQVRSHRDAHTRQPAAGPVANTGQAQFGRGVRAYKRGEYRRAIEIFDAFLARHADSPLAADATLYRADSYLRLAGR